MKTIAKCNLVLQKPEYIQLIVEHTVTKTDEGSLSLVYYFFQLLNQNI